MLKHLKQGCLLILAAAGSGAPAFGQGVILRPLDGERVPPFQDGRTMLLKIGPSLTNSHELFIATEEMPPGTAIPLHRHDRHEEALFLHRGKVTVTLGTRRVVAEAGTVVYIPAATWTGVENTGRDTASVVGIFAEGEVEPCFTRLVQRPSSADSVRLERHCAMVFQGTAR